MVQRVRDIYPPGLQHRGANVLFMDGHAKFIRYQQEFPVTEEACRILDELYKLKATAISAKQRAKP